MKAWKNTSFIKKGVSHEKSGTACQDSVLIRENDNWLVAALADGLGSLKYSDVAANAATEAICQLLLSENTKVFDSAANVQFNTYIMDAVVSSIEKKINLLGITKEQVDCTLVFVGINKKVNRAIVGRLGDSAICVIKEKGSIAINDSNRSANGTNAVLDQDAAKYLDIQLFDIAKEGILGFILSSDGLDNELYMKGSDHVSKKTELYFNALFDGTTKEQASQIIEERVKKLTNIENTPFDDDISIAVLSCAERKIDMPVDPTWRCVCGARNSLQSTYCQKCHRDFSILYQEIRFRDYGGKAAFFARVNEDTDEELRILGGSLSGQTKKPVYQGSNVTGSKQETYRFTMNNSRMSKGQTTVRYQGAMGKPIQPKSQTNDRGERQGQNSNNGQNQLNKTLKRGASAQEKPDLQQVKKIVHNDNKNAEYQEDRSGRKLLKALKINPIILACLVCIVVGAILGGTISKIFSINKIAKLTDDYNELSLQLESAKSVIDQRVKLPQDFAVLEDGSYYWGSSVAGMPNGMGVMLINGNYYIGTFNYGIKNGRFIIVYGDTENEMKLEWYEDDIRIEEQEGQEDNQYETEDDAIVDRNLTKDAATENEIIEEIETIESIEVNEVKKAVGKDNAVFFSGECGFVR